MNIQFCLDSLQGLRILADIMSDPNKTNIASFMYEIKEDMPGYKNYHDKVEKPIWLMKSK